MSYIGKEPQTGAYSMLDALTASATASYSLTLDSVAFVPESANHLIVSLNGHIQKAGSSYNVSSSTLTFSSALTSSDSIDFILALGNVLDIGTPSDATVTNAKTNFVSTSSAAGLQIKGDGTTDGTLQLNCSQNSHGIKLRSPAHSASASYTLTFPTTDGNASEFLQTDGSGVLTWAAASGGTNTPAFEAYLSSNSSQLSNDTDTKITFNSEIYDSDGTYDTSNGRFTPAVAGKYFIYGRIMFDDSNMDINTDEHMVKIFKNGSQESVFFIYPGSNDTLITYAEVITLDDNDYIEIYPKINNGNGGRVIKGAGSSQKSSTFGAFKISGA